MLCVLGKYTTPGSAGSRMGGEPKEFDEVYDQQSDGQTLDLLRIREQAGCQQVEDECKFLKSDNGRVPPPIYRRSWFKASEYQEPNRREVVDPLLQTSQLGYKGDDYFDGKGREDFEGIVELQCTLQSEHRDAKGNQKRPVFSRKHVKSDDDGAESR